MSISFSGYDFRGHIADSFTPEYAWDVGKAFADWLPDEGAVVVVTAPAASEKIIKAVVEGIRLQGRTVINAGQGDQQLLIQTVVAQKAVGGVLVSHEDLQSLEIIQLFQENAVSITSENGLIEISERVEAGNFVPAATKGELTTL